MSDESTIPVPRSLPTVSPDEPLKVGVGTTYSEPVAVKDEPVVTIPAVDYAAVKSLLDVMEGKLETIKADAILDITDLLDKYQKDKAKDYALLRKLLNLDGA